jgi:drug/metabolite transporter (DMT)-like permease
VPENALTIGLVLLAALLHASWNAFAKRSSDPLLALWLITLSGGLLAGALTLAASFPRPEAWPYLAGSMVLHLAYQLFLVAAYRSGDLSQVYPIARGLGPCVVALLAASVGREPLGPPQLLGLALVTLALWSLAFLSAPPRELVGRPVAAAVLTGLMIGSYTFVDARGVRLSDTPLDFISWSLFLDSLPISVVALAGRRGRVRAFLRGELRRGLAGGFMAGTSYGIVLWAMSTTPMASVAALRETGVLFAAWIGTRLLGEPFGVPRMLAAAGVATGIALLQN